MASMDVPADRVPTVKPLKAVVARPTYITWLTLAFMTTSSVASLRSAPTMAVYQDKIDDLKTDNTVKE